VDGELEAHAVRIQEDSIENIRKAFYESLYYEDWQRDNPGEDTVGERIFADAKCDCIKFENQKECADHHQVGAQLKSEAYRRLRLQIKQQRGGAEVCGADCAACNYAPFRDASKSYVHYLQFLLCARKQYPRLSGHQANNYARMIESHLETIRGKTEPTPPKLKRGTVKTEKVRATMPTEQRDIPCFQSHPKKCHELKCQECGPATLNRYRCLQEWSEVNYITWHKYDDMDRNGGSKKQKELVQVTTTHKQFMEEMIADLKTFMPHNWKKQWDRQQRTIQQRSIPADGIIIFVDFSANYECRGQDVVTCGTCNTAYQLVFIVHHSQTTLPNGTKNMTSDAWHFWGHPEKDKLETNFSYYNECVTYLIKHYKQQFSHGGKALNRVWINSDGCRGQFKSRKNIFNLIQLRKTHGLKEIIHTFAPMGCFKCEVDSNGGLCKSWLRRNEQRRNIRCPDCISVFCAITDPVKGMKQPKRVAPEKQNLLTINNRYHRLIVHHTMINKVQAAGVPVGEGSDVLLTDCKDINPTAIDAVSNFYQFRVCENDNNGHSPDDMIVKHRLAPCWCTSCINGEFDLCEHRAETGAWVTSKMTLKPVVVKTIMHADTIATFYNKGGKADNKVLVATYEIDDGGEGQLKFNLMIHKPSKADHDTNDDTTKGILIRQGEQFITCRPLRAIPPPADRRPEEGPLYRYIVDTEYPKPQKLPLHSVVLPVSPDNEMTRENWVKFEKLEVLMLGGQHGADQRAMFTIDSDCMTRLNAFAFEHYNAE